jgi:hypothetical protein
MPFAGFRRISSAVLICFFPQTEHLAQETVIALARRPALVQPDFGYSFNSDGSAQRITFHMIPFSLYQALPPSPITARAHHTGGGDYRFKPERKKKHPAPWFPPAGPDSRQEQMCVTHITISACMHLVMLFQYYLYEQCSRRR